MKHEKTLHKPFTNVLWITNMIFLSPTDNLPFQFRYNLCFKSLGSSFSKRLVMPMCWTISWIRWWWWFNIISMMLIIISTNGPCRDKKLLDIKLKLVGSKVLTRDLDLVTRLNVACWFLTDGLNAALILPTASFLLYELMICAYLLFSCTSRCHKPQCSASWWGVLTVSLFWRYYWTALGVLLQLHACACCVQWLI